MQAVQAGDNSAFEPLLDRHLRHVRTFIALRAPVAHLVDELAHETFVFAFHNIHEFTPGTALRSWLNAIAWNLLRAEVQRFSREESNKARYAESQLWQLAGDRALVENTSELDYLTQCVNEVPASIREVLLLKYQEECSTQEIATRLERSLVWVRTILFRMRQQLKDCIETKTHGRVRC